MNGLDTNVLIRLLLRDDAAQADAAGRGMGQMVDRQLIAAGCRR
jgi:predicted nucleic-acid-binding protein